MTDIQVADLTNTTEVTDGVANGTGIFDRLLNTVNLYIDDQYKDGRLKGSDYANVLLGSIQTVLTQSVQYTLQEKLLEAQVDDVRKGIELKDAQLNSIVLDDTLKAKHIELSNVEIESKTYEKDVLLVDQHETNVLQQTQLEGQIAEVLDATIRANTQLSDQLLTSTKQRALLDTQKESEQYKVDFLMPKELEQMTAQISLTGKQEDQLDEQILISKQEVLGKTYEVTTLLVDQHNTNLKQIEQITTQIDVAERQMVEAETTGLVQRADIVKGTEVKTQQIANMVDELLTNAKQRLDIDKGIEVKEAQRQATVKDIEVSDYNLTSILPLNKSQLELQNLEVADGTARANTQLQDQLVNTAKDREVKERTTVVQEEQLQDQLLTSSKQRLILDTEKEAKQYEVDNILPANLQQLFKQIDVTERGMVVNESELADKLVTSNVQREQLQVQTANLEIQGLLTSAQKDNIIAEGLNIPKQGTILDKQALDIDKGIEVKTEQQKGMFANRVVSDKQAALLGLDQVMKTANAAPEAVYTPKYEV